MGNVQLQVPTHAVPVTEVNGKATYLWWEWFRRLGALMGSGYTGTVTLAALTGGGTQGSLTVVNGVITAYVAPT